MRLINDIIIHCSATLPGQKVNADVIRRWHKAQGWRDIGYHYVILPDGTVERGRPASQAGAHCLRHNAHSIGVCYIGGLDADGQPADTRTKEQKAALLKLVTQLTRLYRCKTHGHRDYANKACPCFDAATEYSGLYRQIVLNLSK